MAEAECAVMVDHPMQVIAEVNLELVFHEVGVRAESSHIEVTDGEIDQVLKLTPLVAEQTEPFQLDDQYRWWIEHLKLFEMHLLCTTLLAIDLVFKLLSPMELRQAIIQSGIVGCICYFIRAFLGRRVFNNLICYGVVILSEDL